MAHRKTRGRKKKFAVYARPTKRKRSRRRPKQGLLFDSGTGAQANLRGMMRSSMSGALGGGYVRVANKFTKGKMIPLLLVSLGGSFVSSKFLKSPGMSAGIAGALAYALLANVPMLNDELEETEYVNPNLLSDGAEYLSEDGVPMYLADDGNFYPLEDMPNDLAESVSSYALADANRQFENVYPGYVNPGFYEEN